jgi:hypothetical protein
MTMKLTEQWAALRALEKVEAKLKSAGAVLPIDVQGTPQSCVNSGLSIALLLVEQEIAFWKQQEVA